MVEPDREDVLGATLNSRIEGASTLMRWPDLLSISFGDEHDTESSGPAVYLLQVFDKIFTPEGMNLIVIVKTSHAVMSEHFRDPFNVSALLPGK